ncbi:fructose-6-phosphate aldolase [Mucilaginibacter limnophilus]|uniref:Fructose-6-phosphate aldolase n=1 Tax=Mucilaginibacter limnophilus TaxID=1932778 RepID=A0A437MYI5_9SPHI|nr:fructose-6-phosphate aldolase [Mucilaginibacter limnophilus]RVU02669.1 fructose-6-phosphate aldolase [Mucilaginibacter limnophilus]
MYIIKVKGVAKIPDYVQLRDDKFTLLAYFRVDRPDKSLDKVGLGHKADYIMNIIKDLPFGQILKLDVEQQS